MAADMVNGSGEKAGGPPEWLSQALDCLPMDVRPLLLEGIDPFAAVMEAVAGIEFGGFLVIDAPFNPSPLRRILAARGFSSYGRKLNAGQWRVFFHLDGGEDWESDAEVDVGPEGAMSWREEDGVHIDVRKLAPPNPMLAILRLIESVGPHEVVVVHHEREPHFLIPELAERGWRIARTSSEVVNVRLWLERMS
ncbi:hypothetical protein CCC_03503 [Paramagnetospirillum magnetotacticum MS-1]|uniref:DUF2249 domain-containing protein n=1 Tax=Paramagnetospirillum magnetotacticum MS-1 TaxID=272627 RepID=A0A0C2YX70_PARME|nr:DUF2249 domain-containing protein [Paramagnetospirillum magnetotacticum]KIL99285.1 hypothetical protein CCC_03503 [Paramagnetospirillum magnetotacticum MS-1]